jgi:thioredoxin reductase
MYDVVVVGGGPAGLSAALMLGRCRRRVLLCDAGQPRNRRASALHGYLTRDGIAPPELNKLGRAELLRYGIELRQLGVTSAHQVPGADRYRVCLADGTHEEARFLLIATGVVDDLPGITGFDDCYGRSLFHCPYCDGWEWRDRRIAVFGRPGGGAHLALALTTWSADVVLCTHGGRIDRARRERLARNGVAVQTKPIARLEHTDGALTAIVFESGDRLPRDVMFFTTGQHPQSDLATTLGCALTHRGTVRTGTLCDTNIPRVFVAGDASRDAQFVVVAAAEGVKAAVAINQAIQTEGIE